MAEPNGSFRTIASYEWASTCQYIVWVSSRIGMREISADTVYSFPLSKLGPDKLMRRKQKASTLLQENIEAIEAFVTTYKDSLEEAELNVIRGMWRSQVNARGVVVEHITRLEALSRVMAAEIEYLDLEVIEDELPF